MNPTRMDMRQTPEMTQTFSKQSLFSSLKIGNCYCIGGNSEKKNIEVVKNICDYLDQIKPKQGSYLELIEFVEDRPGHDFRYAIDASKIETELGWKAEETFESGIKKTVSWYLNHKDRFL